MKALFPVCCGLTGARTLCPHSQAREWPRESFSLNSKSADKHWDSLRCAYQHALFTYLLLKSNVHLALEPFPPIFYPSGILAARPSQTIQEALSMAHYPPSLLQGAAGLTVTSKPTLVLLSSISGRRTNPCVQPVPLGPGSWPLSLFSCPCHPAISRQHAHFAIFQMGHSFPPLLQHSKLTYCLLNSS